MDVSRGRKVLLIGWDAADWRVIRPLMEAGKMPHLQRLVDSAAVGQIATLHPPLSPMLWTSVATGKRPFKHGIHGFAEPAADGRDVQPVTNLSRTAKAIWNILNQNCLRSVVVGWWPSHPAEPISGVMVSDRFHHAAGPLLDDAGNVAHGWPLATDAVHPPVLAETLAGLRIHPDLLTPAMVERFIPQARGIDQDRDKRLALFLRTLAECMSIQAAATWLMRTEPWDFFAVYYDALDHFSHGFMRYHPPRLPSVEERDFGMYRNVVSVAYEFHDEMLGTLLRDAGGDVTVILMSDHGFHPDHLRPATIPDGPAGPAIEHSDYGIFVASGPGIQGGAVRGASLLDIAPTILALYGLPVGQDMDGRVLTQIFAGLPTMDSVPSWEDVVGPDGCHPADKRADPEAAQQALEQMIALGYVERPDSNHEIAVARTIRELRYNLAQAYQDAARHAEALEIFRELRAAGPDDIRFAVRLVITCGALGLVDEMRSTVEDVERRGRTQQPMVAYLKAQVIVAEKRFAEAVSALEALAASDWVRPGLALQIGDLYVRLRRWSDARQIFEGTLHADPGNAQAHLGLARVALGRRDFESAAESALDSLQCVYDSADAHYTLGVALAGMKQFGRAAEAFRAAISFNPNFPQAHRRLARLLEMDDADAAEAREHRLLAKQMRVSALSCGV